MEWFTAAEKFNQALASANPTPGGGAAAAMAASMGCSLALMAAQTTFQKKNVAAEVQSRLEPAIRKLFALSNQLNQFIQEDSAAYSAYLVAKKLPKEDPSREQAMQEALWYAARIPADTATTAIACLREIESIQTDIAPVILSDIECGQNLLRASIKCSIANIHANLVFIKNPERIEKLQQQITTFSKFC